MESNTQLKKTENIETLNFVTVLLYVTLIHFKQILNLVNYQAF